MSTGSSFSRVRRAAAAALLLGALGGCTDGDPGVPTGSPVAVLAAAPDRTLRAGTAEISITSDLAEYHGSVDFSGGSGTVTPAVPRGAEDPAPQALRAGVDLGADDPLVGATSYNPFFAIDVVRGATNVRPFGGRQVKGNTALQYRIDIDLDRAVDAAPDASRDALRAAIDPIRAGDGFTTDVFVDSNGRFVRIDLPRDLADPEIKNRRGFKATTTIELDWGNDG